MQRALILSIAALATAACTKPQQKSGDARDSGATQAGIAIAAAAPNVVTVHAKDYAFTGPSAIPAGTTTFRLVNDGPGLHHLQLVKLDSGKTAADFEQALSHPGPPPRWATFFGGPNAPSPGDTSIATVNLPAGNYAIVCLVDIPGGVPHIMKGMYHPLTVTAASAGVVAAGEPAPDIRVTLEDYGFVLSTPITAGTHTIDVSNTAMQPHEIEIIRLDTGKTAQDVLAWMQKMQGPPPGVGVGGISALVPGVHQQFVATFAPGTYMLSCFLPDAKDGKPHVTHGMLKTITVS